MLATTMYLKFLLRKTSRQGLIVVCPFALMSWKTGGFRERQLDVDGDGDQQEGNDERHPPSPIAEGLGAHVALRTDDHGQG